VDALSPVKVSLLNAKLSALEACLEPGLTRLNWNSQGIDSFVGTTTKAIQEFQALHHSVKKNSAIVEKLVNGLAAAQLVVDLPAGVAGRQAQPLAGVRCTYCARRVYALGACCWAMQARVDRRCQGKAAVNARAKKLNIGCCRRCYGCCCCCCCCCR
jgi:hypothetical protein